MGAAMLGGLIADFLLILFVVMCLLIGVKTLVKREVQIGRGKVWRGWSTLVLGIPLTLIGVIVGLAVSMTWLR